MKPRSVAHPPPAILKAFADGRLNGTEFEVVERHLLGCDHCCRQLEDNPEDALVARLRRASAGGTTDALGMAATDGPAAAVDPVPAAPPGFEILGEVGRGGMGVVFKARQAALNRVVALKVVLAGGFASPEHRSRFVREAEAAAGVGHPHVVQVYEAGSWAGQPYLVLEFCPGGTLAERLGGRPLTPRRSAALVEQLARAVQAAHDRGVVHRDLKPQNVLLAADGTPKVADFGLAKLTDAADGLTASGAVMGTPSYMAPEQAAGRAGVGPAADVYALGAILYECLTGRPPFRGPTPMDTVVQVLEQDAPDPRVVRPGADPDLAAVARKCLEKNPADRYATAADLAADLGRRLRGEATQARRRHGFRRLTAWGRREPGLAVRLAVLAVGAVVMHLRFRLDGALGPGQHLQILVVLAAWAATAVACQVVLRRGPHRGVVARVWLGSDAVFLTGVLALNRGHDSPLIGIYWLIVVVSGLWLRAELVRFTTTAAVIGYLALIGQAAVRGELRSAPLHHLIAVATLIAAGEAVAYQVRRVRLLDRYFGNRPTGPVTDRHPAR